MVFILIPINFRTMQKFANLKLDEIVDTDRDEISKEKRNRSDFALWKFSPKMKRQMEWESPWGVGFPAGILSVRQCL